MKKVLYLSLLLLVPVFISCVDDLGNDTISEINEIEISGIEESYTKIARQETLAITPEIKGSLSASDESNLSYEWFLCDNGIEPNHNHITISTERNLNYFVESNPRNYTLYFSVLDNTTGLKWEKETELNVVSPMVRGFYLAGDKADGTVGIDFLSFIDGRDTAVVKNIYLNAKNLKGAKNVVFTGYYYSDYLIDLWIMAENGSYQLEKSASLVEIKEIEDMNNPDRFLFPTVAVSKPEQVMDVLPRAYSKSNTMRSRSRIIMTENNCYAASVSYDPIEAYGNPFNCYAAASSELFKPSKYIFHKENTTSISAITLYDETNHCFVRANTYSNYGTPTYCIKINDASSQPFYFDQTKYTPVRDLVYGENGVANAGRSYALMGDADGKYFVYQFTAPSTAFAAYDIDMSVATEFAQAEKYAFYSSQPIILYAVGAKLYAYDYVRKDCKLVNTFDAEITYLAMDYSSNNSPSHIWVATYGTSGKIYGYNIEDNQNAINVTPVEHEVFDTDLKVVKMEYRNVAI